MLGKLLKYDLKSMLKYWWITAISSLVLSAAGGASLTYIINSEDYPSALIFPMVLLVFLAFLGMFGFIILSTIFIFTRFYKNFFTDEGYLTFTLPVSRFALLNSKLISSVAVMLFSGIIFIVEIALFAGIPIVSSGAWAEVADEFSAALSSLMDSVGSYIFVYLAEGLVALVLSCFFSTLLLFFCITFGAMVTKKNKVLAAIGFYYGASYVVSLFTQGFMMFGVESLTEMLLDLPDTSVLPIVALIGLGLIAIMVIVCLLLYTLEYWMLDRKLNLN